MGLHADRAFNFLYSISEDGHFKLTELKNYTIVADIQVSESSSGLKCLLYSETRGVFIISDGEGWIYIYNQAAQPPELAYKVQTQAMSCIRGMCISAGGSYLVAVASDGSLSIFELGRIKGERFTKQIAAFQGRPNVRV